MRKTVAFLAVFLTGLLTWNSGCGKKKENQAGAKANSAAKAQDQAPKATERAKVPDKARPAGDAQGQGEVVDGTEAQMLVLAVDKPIREKIYTLTMTGPAKVEKGKPAVFTLNLVPKNPYHTNKLFPFKLTFDKVPTGVKLDKQVFSKKDAAVFSPEKAVFKVSVTPTGALPVTVTGLYKFSICTPKFCETPKAKVVLNLGGKKEARPAAKAEQTKGAAGQKAPARK